MPLLAAKKKMSPELPKKKMSKKKIADIKEKLSGKNYSPIVASAKSSYVLKKKKPAAPSKSSVLLNKKKVSVSEQKPPVVEADEPKKLIKSQKNPLKKSIEVPVIVSSKISKKTEDMSETLVSASVVEADEPKKLKKSKTNPLKRTMEVPVTVSSKISKKTEPPVSASGKAAADKKDKSKKDLSEVLSSNVFFKTKMKTRSSKVSSPAQSQVPKKKKMNVIQKPVVQTSTESLKADSPTETQENKVKEKVEKVKTLKVKKGKKLSGELKPISNIKSLRKKTALKKGPERGTVIFKNIPHGFYEKEIKTYCSQFGKVTGVYHPVSKNGNSRGYAFVQFLHKEVADVVAETMNNYVMFYKRMRCEVVPKERQRPGMFRVKKSNEAVAREKREAALKQRTKQLNKSEVTAWEKRKKARVAALHKKLAALDADYEFKVADRATLNEQLKQTTS